MKSILTGLLAVSLLGGANVPAKAAGNDFKALFAKHWQISKEFTLAVAEAMPADLLRRLRGGPTGRRTAQKRCQNQAARAALPNSPHVALSSGRHRHP
jgi:hypothetical protein